MIISSKIEIEILFNYNKEDNILVSGSSFEVKYLIPFKLIKICFWLINSYLNLKNLLNQIEHLIFLIVKI